MAVATSTAMLASTAASAFSNIWAGQQGKAAAEFNAKQAELDADLAKQQAAFEERNFRAGVDRLLGQQRAGYAKAGVQMTGSALDVAQDTTMQSEMDALLIRYNGIIKSNGYRTQAALQRLQGASAQTQGFMSATGSILTGYAQWSSMQDQLKANPVYQPTYTGAGLRLPSAPNLDYMGGGQGVRIK